MIIGVDIDNTLNNLCEAVLEVYNEDSGDFLKIDDIKSYWIEEYVKEQYKKNFKNYFLDKRVWRKTKIDKNCQKYIAKLFNDGHTILFITSTEPDNLKKKAGWLTRNFPYLDIRKSLYCCPHKQYMSEIDMLIDDAPQNLDGGKFVKIMIEKPWNQDYKGAIKVKNWKEVYDVVTSFERG